MSGRLVLKGRDGLYQVADSTNTSTELIDADTGEWVGPELGSANLDPTLIQYATVTITNAELLALNTTPIALVAAPGAGKVLELTSIALQYDYASAAFTIGSATNLQVKYTDGSGAAASATASVTGFLDQSADEYRVLPQNSSSIEPVANAALVLTLAGANVSAGGGSLVVKVAYRVHSFA